MEQQDIKKTESDASTVHEYRVVSGSFRDTDGSIKGVGETITLADHDAAVHGMAVELVTAEDKTDSDPAAVPVSLMNFPGSSIAA